MGDGEAEEVEEVAPVLRPVDGAVVVPVLRPVDWAVVVPALRQNVTFVSDSWHRG